MWVVGKEKASQQQGGRVEFFEFFFSVSRRLEGVSGQIDERTFTRKNIFENISFDEKKAERNRFILSLSLSLRVPKGLKK